ncbi:peptide ABC transporter permease [Halobacteriales archaeon QH_7_69_31]|nr:MAG: peptide ABC transporter permease [Halobacteriales archaeon QH_7_69_31]
MSAADRPQAWRRRLDGTWSRRLRSIAEDRLDLLAWVIIAALVVSAVFAKPIRLTVPSVLQTLSGGFLAETVTLQPLQLAPHDPIDQNLADRLHPPSREYPLGTDQLGRDILSRLMVGARISLSVGVVVVSISLMIGTAVGVVSGYLGGWVDEAVMRIVDIVLAFPGLLLALVVAGILGPSLTNIMIALAVVGWTQYARIVRGSVLSVKQRDFVAAAKLMGVSEPRLVSTHVIPNVIGPVVILATLDMAYVILATAGLSFLGLGAQPPTPEWGTMLSQGRHHLLTAWWIANVPGVAIMVAVLAFNILGDSLRDLLDPRVASRLEGKGGL